jgi:hypothetical protein
MRDPVPVRRPLLRRIVLPLIGVLLLAVGWTGAWFYAAARADALLAGWRQREAAEGRVYACGAQTIGGFPFRFDVRCAEPSAEFRGSRPALALKAKDIRVAAQIYQPTGLIADFDGPLTVTDLTQSAAWTANWTLGQASARGTPAAPERASFVFDGLNVTRGDGSGPSVFQAKRFELHGRVAEGSVAADPVIEIVLRLATATAPELHRLTEQPLDANVTTTLRGLHDFAPRPWPERLRELQARGGRIEISQARIQQGEVIAVSEGHLGLTPAGRLDGQLQITVVGMDKVLKALDIDRVMSQGEVGSALNALDRLMPGLGQFARQNAAPGIVAGLGAMGKGTVLEGKSAVTLPLRFADGTVFLGPVPVGQVPPLF